MIYERVTISFARATIRYEWVKTVNESMSMYYERVTTANDSPPMPYEGVPADNDSPSRPSDRHTVAYD
jgi:hypothetical protein